MADVGGTEQSSCRFGMSKEVWALVKCMRLLQHEELVLGRC